jgi:hypothetical protein
METDISAGTRVVRKIVKGFFSLLVLAALGLALWTWATLNYAYSKGERAGYVQKISKKGWVCKTWEGELAMANLPGAMPEIFYFSVRDESVAKQIMKSAGQRVALAYEAHLGIPTSCFGETPHFITGVSPMADLNASSQSAPSQKQ